MQEKEEYLEKQINPIIKKLIYQLVNERPNNPCLFMVKSLQKTVGCNDSVLTNEEKKELEYLKKEVSKYQARESSNTKEGNFSFLSIYESMNKKK